MVALSRGYESRWCVRLLHETGSSRRAWLWTSICDEAVCFHIEDLGAAEVASTQPGTTLCILFLVYDRLSSQERMTCDLHGPVIVCWCCAHQRRAFIDWAAGAARRPH